MEALASPAFPRRNAIAATLLSLMVPGLGQYYANARERAAWIFAATLGQAYLIAWGLDKLKIAQVSLGGLTTSWLWVLFVLFWLWNVYDARCAAQGKSGSGYIGVLIATLVIYVIAWEVTDVRLDRLIARFGNALRIGD